MSDHLFLIDTHAHLDGPEFQADLAATLERARAAGLSHMVTVGADLPSSRAALALAQQHEELFCAIGVHPHDALQVDAACIEEIRAMAADPKVVAIGEIGLDFYRDRSPRDVQEEVFRRFIRLARELELPIIVHDRDAHERVMTILREEKADEVGGVLHCFSGNADMAADCIAMGFLISIPGTVTYPSNETLREVVRGVKIEHLLVETDCPYLSPVPHRGKRNEPAHVRLTAAKVAELKGLTLEDVGRITSLNARRLFGISLEAEETAIAYPIRDSLYLNITNRCSNRCTFCPKFSEYLVKGHQLRLDHEPTTAEILHAIGDPRPYAEIVFCGFGESLIRLDIVKEVATALKGQGATIRVNTDGQANRFHGRNILPELTGLVDAVSVSLNAADPVTYQRLTNTPFGEEGFLAICDFLREAPSHIPRVVATAVAVPGLDMVEVRKLAESLGVEFREREYAEVG